MLSSTKASDKSQYRVKKYICIFLSVILFGGLFAVLPTTYALTKENSFSKFPPGPVKFVRINRARQLRMKPDPPANEMPYWRLKKNIYKKMLEERLITVSVHKSKISEELIAFDVKGAGIVHAQSETALKISQEYSKLTKVSSHFKSAYFDEKNSQLFLVVEAFGFETRMILAMDLVTEKKRSEIQFEVVWGELKGMTGAIGFENMNDESCEVSILSHYQAARFPLPKIFMGFAFEVLTQKVAEKMRSYIESEK